MRELTPREHEVMALVIEGYPVKTIAAKLDVKYNTVKTQIFNSFRKLGAKNGAHAAAIYVRSQGNA